ncbi:MAG: helix-turn-helix domain-containing protein [Oscillospiraceae bacterium]|jgi:transcriptional regulator with XRE-family HTH domain|nr:helix-turn-helix domain-containing protein [Oscillospiraceae bacterium]
MTIYIAENIRRLRRERGITQEKLADSLGVTTQAVSKWERGEAFPDMTLILPIAGYFGVTTDELFGLDANEAGIKRYLEEIAALSEKGAFVEQAGLLNRALAEFPYSWLIVEAYISYYMNFEKLLTDDSYKNERLRQCRRVLDECTIERLRYFAAFELAKFYAREGDHAAVRELLKNFAEPHYFNRDEILPQLYLPGSDEYFRFERENVQRITVDFAMKIMQLAKFGNEKPGEKIRILQKAIDVFDLVYDEGDFGDYYVYISNLYFEITKNYVELGDFKAAIEYFRRGFEAARTHDTLPDVVRCSSYLVRGIETPTKERFFVRLRLDDQVQRYKGSAFSKTVEFKSVIARYSAV